MRKEYPPMLRGRAEEQLAQLRAYLVRLADSVDEALEDAAAGSAAAPDPAAAAWRESAEQELLALRRAERSRPLLQFGALGESGSAVFPRPYAAPPAVFTTAGTASNVTALGFTLTTSAPAQWIAVGQGR